MAKAKSQPKRKKNGYAMPDPLPNGEILEDIFKKQWKLGPSIGKGGFGEIYSAQPASDTKNSKYPYVVKIEPHENGPLFVEVNVLKRIGKQSDIESFKSARKLKSFGMPSYVGSGSHDHRGKKYRFLVMEKFGSDIWKHFLRNNRSFPEATVFKIAIDILHVLEYMHGKTYVHADVKGANILCSLSNPNQVYLVDFGLAGHYSTAEQFKRDPKKTHDGTIEYLSRDAHQGVQTRRGDIEVLAFNIIQWLGCTLPWENNLKQPVAVQESKEKHMNDIPGFLKSCFGTKKPPVAVLNLLKYINTVEFNVEPDYKKVHKILLSGLESAGGTLTAPLQFTASKSPTKRKSDKAKSPGKKKTAPKQQLQDVGEDSEDEDEDVTALKPKRAKTTPKKRGKKTAPKPQEEEDVDEDSENEDEEVTALKEEMPKASPKKRAPKADEEKVANGEGDGDTNGYTSEMKRYKSMIDATKKIKVSKSRAKKGASAVPVPSVQDGAVRSRRTRKEVDYNEGSPKTERRK